jgi:hypothetical protein
MLQPLVTALFPRLLKQPATRLVKRRTAPRWRVLLSAVVLCLTVTASATAAPEEAQPQEISPEEAAAAAQAKREQEFSRRLTGATMTGSFTMDRADDGDRDTGREPAKPPLEESYEISSATHLGGELWLITSRIRYGDVDATVPVPVAVKWAGTTPVITLDQVTIPGMGTFSARVLFHGDRYAGTWQHDDVGGHMFGRVKPKPE